jgi:hypothetical protein
MTEKVLRFPDPERKSREPDAVTRDPADAVVIIFPAVRKLNGEPITDIKELCR